MTVELNKPKAPMQIATIITMPQDGGGVEDVRDFEIEILSRKQ